MKRTINILTLLIFSLTALAQDKYLARLSMLGGINELGISPSEEVWGATRAGDIYFTKQIGDMWHIGPLDSYSSSSSNVFDRINFFSNDTLMISGFIQENGKQDFVYWSGNHGKKWEKVKFGVSSWIDAAYIDNNGTAWMSGSSQLIYHTKDKGKTWLTFNKIEPKGNMRVSSIYFLKDEKTGLFGTSWNAIYKTLDNCKSWEKLISPLSQKKYVPISKTERADITKVRILGNYYIVNQQGRVFTSNSERIDWQRLPNAVDFEVTEDNNLYVINKDLTVALYSADMVKTWQSDKHLNNLPRAIAVRNNKLFALSNENLYKISTQDFVSTQLFTDDIAIPEPDYKITYEGEEFGFYGKDILRFDKEKAKWFRFMTLDFFIENPIVYQNRILIADAGEINKYYQINVPGKALVDYKLPDNIFSNNAVTEIHFEQGSQGCFHSNNSIRSYKKIGNKFTLDIKRSTPKYLTQSPKEIEESTVRHLIALVENSKDQQLSSADLNISVDDIKRFKTFVSNEELRIKKTGVQQFDKLNNLYSFPGENTDFGFYRSVADSLNKVSNEDINNAFWQANGSWSTTTDSRRVILVFGDGKKVVIENSDDMPNYLYTPWVVDYEGLKFKTNSISFGRAIDKITKSQFFVQGISDKNYALFKIADYLYKNKLLENDAQGVNH